MFGERVIVLTVRNYRRNYGADMRATTYASYIKRSARKHEMSWSHLRLRSGEASRLCEITRHQSDADVCTRGRCCWRAARAQLHWVTEAFSTLHCTCIVCSLTIISTPAHTQRIKNIFTHTLRKTAQSSDLRLAYACNAFFCAQRRAKLLPSGVLNAAARSARAIPQAVKSRARPGFLAATSRVRWAGRRVRMRAQHAFFVVLCTCGHSQKFVVQRRNIDATAEKPLCSTGGCTEAQRYGKVGGRSWRWLGGSRWRTVPAECTICYARVSIVNTQTHASAPMKLRHNINKSFSIEWSVAQCANVRVNAHTNNTNTLRHKTHKRRTPARGEREREKQRRRRMCHMNYNCVRKCACLRACSFTFD